MARPAGYGHAERDGAIEPCVRHRPVNLSAARGGELRAIAAITEHAFFQ